MAIRDQLSAYDAYQRFLVRKNEAWLRESKELSFALQATVQPWFTQPGMSLVEFQPNFPVWKDEFLYQYMTTRPYEATVCIEGSVEITESISRGLLVVEENTQVTLSQVATGDMQVLDIVVKKGATLVHDVCVVDCQFHYLNVHVHAGACYTQTYALSHQGRRAMRVILEDSAVANIHGASVSKGYLREHVWIEHIGQNSQSSHTLRSLCYDKIDVYSTVNVHKQAMNTDSHQMIQHLLLEAHSKAFSKPALTISTDDVSCVHGATMSMVDKHLLFYLLSRGLHYDVAKSLYVEGFVKEIYEGKEALLASILQAYHEK